ncbi:hypothetical protein [Photobacterium sp. OFAV2-7]|nr:hypothetical protein [Photobacterium sp. OFAV2-7]
MPDHVSLSGNCGEEQLIPGEESKALHHMVFFSFYHHDLLYHESA